MDWSNPAEPPVLPPDSLFESLPISFTWSEIKDVMRYRWRLLDEGNGATLLDGETREARLDLTSLSNGHYRLTLRSLGENGMESADAVARFEVKQSAPPAELQAPADGVVLPSKVYDFSGKPRMKGFCRVWKFHIRLILLRW